ncbi:MAG: carbamate kinase [Deltaproteobacteria bacterium]|nr:carbamate kinase [Deltaproteobacteria bacterium]
MKKIVVVAVGGNSLIADKDHQTVKDQAEQAAKTMSYIASLIEDGYEVVITHGNGPQVGFILLRSEFARDRLHTVPLDSCGADTQGAIGYNFQMALGNEFRRRGINKSVATVVTQVVVDSRDKAFKNPLKPIGPFYKEEEILKLKEQEGWDVVEDAGRGWRRVVPSPAPQEIIELDVIKKLISAGVVVIAVGGGGIPVVRTEAGDLKGVAAVIDKDHASALLANKIAADFFIISTDVEKVCINYKKPHEKAIDYMTIKEAKDYIKQNQFSPGSMLPKVEAVISYLENGGKKAIITNFEHLGAALDGKSGTLIVT